MTVWFTSDTHYGHRNIIKWYEGRRNLVFESMRPLVDADKIDKAVIHSMDASLIANHNSKVQPSDVIYNLGDFTFHHDKARIDEIFNQLNGEKHLIVGNHESPYVLSLPWKSISFLKEIHVEGQRLVLCHYGMRVWNRSHHGAIQLYGHSHGSLLGTSQSVDVGVDGFAQYYPVTLTEILRELKRLPDYRSGDHHQGSNRE